VCSPDDGLIRAETCREYISYLIKTLSIVAKQKVLLFTVNNTFVSGIVAVIKKKVVRSRTQTIFFFKPNLFAICSSTFSKWLVM
jgi:hypothetical protein